MMRSSKTSSLFISQASQSIVTIESETQRSNSDSVSGTDSMQTVEGATMAVTSPLEPSSVQLADAGAFGGSAHRKTAFTELASQVNQHKRKVLVAKELLDPTIKNTEQKPNKPARKYTNNSIKPVALVTVVEREPSKKNSQ